MKFLKKPVAPSRSLEESLLLLKSKTLSAPLSFAQIWETLSGKGVPLLLILLSLPFCQPLQIPGFSTPFGLMIAFLGLRMSLGKGLWLPQKLLSQTIPPKTFEQIIDKTILVTKKLKRWIHPRWYWVCHSPFMEKLNGIVIFILGIFLSLPLPIPLSNMISAWSIFLISLGILEDDGLLVSGGYLLFFITFAFFLLITLTAKNLFT